MQPAIAANLDADQQYLKGILSKNAEWKSGLAFVGAMKQRILSFSDYVFDSSLRGLSKDKLKTGGGRYYYKKEHRARLEVKSGGMSNGAVVVKQANGQIRGSGGGALRFMKMNLEPDSRMLMLPNGYNAISSDFGTLLVGVEKKTKSGASVRISSSSVSDKRWTTPVTVVEITQGGNLTERIFVNPTTKIPLEWDVYRNGNLISVTTFSGFKANQNLDDKLFEL